jgi:hypothetical protein
MISPVIETHAAVMPRKCTRATLLSADSLSLRSIQLWTFAQELDVRLRNLEQYEREIVSKPLSNWGKFAICYRNFRSQRKEYGK